MPDVILTTSDPVPPGAPLYFVPRLVDAFGYRVVDVEVEHGTVVAEIMAANSGQRGYLVHVSDAPVRPVLRYRLKPFADDPPEWIWTPPENRYVRPSRDLSDAMRALVAGASTEAEAGQRIVDHVAARFWYGHGEGTFIGDGAEVPLARGLNRGHCVDIHGYCVAAFRAVGLTAAYAAGFWFKQGTVHAPAMHCWFVARLDGAVVHYDVSHHLKVPMSPVRPGLNPLPGRRVLASVGKGLAFEVAGRMIELTHFARPIWLTEDGRVHYPAHALEIVGETDAEPAVGADLALLEPAC